MTRATFMMGNNSFHKELKSQVDNYFKHNKLKITGNWKLYSKTIILFTTAATIYALLMTVSMPFWASLPLCALLGLNFAAIGFNVMHDGGHGSFSTNKRLNKMMAYSLDAMGGSAFLWNIKHNQNHHSFTNIEGMDDDIDIRPWIRTNENQEHKWFHRYQHIYWAFFYSFTYLFWIFFADYKKYITRRVADIQFKKMSTKEHIKFWASKVLFLVIFLVLPMIKLGVVDTLIGFTTLGAVCGFTLGIVFQMAHLVQHTDFPIACAQTNIIQREWAVHQIETTANFATKNKFVSWLTGGLNYQVEHHLFPRVSHVHYPALSEIVKDTCAKHKIEYIEYPTFFKALKSHVLYLKEVGAHA